MDRYLLGGVELHPLLGLAINSTCFSHFEFLTMLRLALDCFGGRWLRWIVDSFGAKEWRRSKVGLGYASAGGQANKQIPAGIVRNAGAYLIGKVSLAGPCPQNNFKSRDDQIIYRILVDFSSRASSGQNWRN